MTSSRARASISACSNTLLSRLQAPHQLLWISTSAGRPSLLARARLSSSRLLHAMLALKPRSAPAAAAAAASTATTTSIAALTILSPQKN